MDQIPSSTNTPNLTKNKNFAFVLALFVLIKVISLLVTPNLHKGQASDLTVDNILNAVNRERLLRNLTTLNSNSKLSYAGQSKADDMQARHYFAHIDPDGNYIWDKIVSAGYTPYLQLGENLAIEFYDTDSLVSAWMNSPTHRANVLQEGFKDQGMGLNFGDTSSGQYHSAIANTFGTLVVSSKETKTPKPTSQPTDKKIQVVPEIKLTTTPEQTLAAEIPIPEKPSSNTTTPAPNPEALKIRGEVPLVINTEKNFSLPDKSAEQPSATTAQPVIAVIGSENSTKIVDLQITRYLILVCGVALLLLMLNDIKIIIEKKIGSLDKKINNLALLFIALIVIGFMYWF